MSTLGQRGGSHTTQSKKMTVREATFDLLRSLDVDTFFGNPGSTELPFLDRWPDDIKYVLGLQEASVIAMADGYARATGKAGFLNVHSAAGLGHALGNLFTAYRNRAPLVITAGQQARELMPNQPFLGATEAAQFPKPYVKFSIEPARAEDVPAAIAQAHRIAMQRPFGPTFVSIPVDDWTKPCWPVHKRHVSQDFAPDDALIADAVSQINAARRPVFVVGPEVDEENAGPAMVALAEKIKAPVLTAPFSSRISFPEDHPLFAGFLPAAPQAVSDTLIDYDLIIVVGAPVFTYHVPGESLLVRSNPAVIHLTTDGEAAASAPMGTSILGSLRFSLPALSAALSKSDRVAPQGRKPAAPPKSQEDISPQYFLHKLGQIMPKNAVLSEEAPSFRPIMQEHVIMREWGSFFTMASGGLGYGLPAAVGLALAQPEKKVVCLIGDGSFMYSPQALWTAVQQNLNLAVVIMNNGGYGAMRSFSRALQVTGVPGIEFSGLDFVEMAHSMGCEGTRITRSDEIGGALERVLSAKGPSVLEVMVSSEVQILY